MATDRRARLVGDKPEGALMLRAVGWSGWGVVLLSTINRFELFGLRQVYARLRGETLRPPVFKAPPFYKRVGHPIYLGFLLAFWTTPSMTVGHLLFAAGTTGYIVVGIYLEERDLIALFGDQYRGYRQEVSMLIPLPGRNAEDSPKAPCELEHR
jgi:methanethiol S-methyltransferase